MSANTSKPSKVQPRFEATSAFHCVRSSERYQGVGAMVTDSVIISSLWPWRPLAMKSLRYYQVRLEECAADIAQPNQSFTAAGE
jgi:hypothetical protein